jgi:putative ABC transport system permease protein
MHPPTPSAHHHVAPSWLFVDRVLSQQSMMALRNIAHHPLRSTLTTVGIAMATGILVVSLFMRDSVEQLIDVTYFMSDRQDVTISFTDKRPQSVVMEAAHLPGVLTVEPYRQIPVRIRNGNIERRVVITARPRDADLNRIVDINYGPVVLPDPGLAISAYLATILGVSVGNRVEVDLLEGARRTVSLPVVALIEDYFGIRGMMNTDALSDLMREAPAADGVNLSVDASELGHLYDAIKRVPNASGLALQSVSLAMFRETLAIIVTVMASIYTGLAAVIAFGIVYNSARISLSERGRELASLRVLGFTAAEVFRIVAVELALLALIAQLPGWAIGYGLAWIMNEQLAGEVMRMPMALENLTYVLASAVVTTAALLSALIVYRRINHLDLVEVLKTRE